MGKAWDNVLALWPESRREAAAIILLDSLLERSVSGPAIADATRKRRYKVMRKRLGFEGAPQSPEEIARSMHVTPARVRQIEQAAMRTLVRTAQKWWRA